MINRFIIGATHQKVVWNYVFELPSKYESIKSESSLNIDSLTEIKLQLIAWFDQLYISHRIAVGYFNEIVINELQFNVIVTILMGNYFHQM